MRVLHVSKLYPPFIGGVETAVQRLAEGLRDANRGIEPEVLCCQPKGPEVLERVNGIPVRRVSSLGMGWGMPLSPAMALQWRRLTREYDLIHLHVPFPLANLGEVLHREGPPVVVHYHSQIVRQRLLAPLYRPVDARVLRRAKRIIVGSPNMLEVPELAPVKDKCRVIPYPHVPGPPVQAATQARLTARLNLGGGPLVLYVGRLGYYKGLPYLIEAMLDVEAKLVIAGDGPLRKELEEQVTRAGLTHKIQFIGAVTDEEKECLYGMATVFVLPSILPSEAFGLVQVEAMAHGVPVVNTALASGVPWVSPHGETGLTVPPRESSALSKALNRIVFNPAERERFANGAGLRAKTFSRDQIIRALIDEYQAILAESRIGSQSLPPHPVEKPQKKPIQLQKE
ncbi:MAG TPA: glycosyltransferase [Candidatus Thermoplasmatota archaeon]|nr:glycosyltransferase [Candidatus Thermoplasmatota archaeon]